jgi:hypothetical protein
MGHFFCSRTEPPLSDNTFLMAALLVAALAVPSAAQELHCDNRADCEMECHDYESMLDDLNEGYRHSCEITSSTQVIIEDTDSQGGMDHTVYLCVCTNMEINAGDGGVDDDGPVYRPGPIGPPGAPRTPRGFPDPHPTLVNCLQEASKERQECQKDRYGSLYETGTNIRIPGGDTKAEDLNVLEGFDSCLEVEEADALICKQKEQRRRRAENENSAN